jgi:Tfp pilus assembly protein PilF
MQGMDIHCLRMPKGQSRIGLLLLALMLLALAGCVTTGKQKPEPAKEEPAVTEEGPSVTQLNDGREGFKIRETPHLEKETVGQFEGAVAMMEHGEYEKAADLLETVIEEAPEVTAPYIDMAIACRHLERLEEAEEYLETALELVPGHPVASNEYGLLLRKAGRFDEARKIYEQSLANFPDYQPVRKNLGILCDLYLRDPVCALEQYEIYSKAMPEDKQVKLWIADLQMRLKK